MSTLDTIAIEFTAKATDKFFPTENTAWTENQLHRHKLSLGRDERWWRRNVHGIEWHGRRKMNFHSNVILSNAMNLYEVKYRAHCHVNVCVRYKNKQIWFVTRGLSNCRKSIAVRFAFLIENGHSFSFRFHQLAFPFSLGGSIFVNIFRLNSSCLCDHKTNVHFVFIFLVSFVFFASYFWHRQNAIRPQHVDHIKCLIIVECVCTKTF